MSQENVYNKYSTGLHAEMSYAHVSSLRVHVGFKLKLVSWLYTTPETNWYSLSRIQSCLVKWVKKTCTIALVQDCMLNVIYAHVSSQRLYVGFKSNLFFWLYTPPETNWCSLSWIQCYLVKWVKKTCTIDLVQCNRLKCCTPMSRLGDYVSDWSQTWFPDCTPHQKQTGVVWAESNAIWWNKSRKRVQQI